MHLRHRPTPTHCYFYRCLPIPNLLLPNKKSKNPSRHHMPAITRRMANLRRTNLNNDPSLLTTTATAQDNDNENDTTNTPTTKGSRKHTPRGGTSPSSPPSSLASSSSWRWRPELWAIATVYLVQGLLGLSRLAIFTFFKDDLRLDPGTVGLLTSLGMAPWVIKPVYGFLSDSVPLWGYRRRSYLILCGCVGTASWVALSGPVDSASTAVLALVAGSLSTACADVVADSIVVELCRGEPQSTAGSLQSMCWASASFGAILSAYFSGWMVEAYGPRPVFLVTAVFPLLVALSSALIPEERFSSSQSAQLEGAISSKMVLLKAQVRALWSAVSQRSILYPALFVFLWQATPSADTAMLFFETNELGFTTEFLGRIRLVASIASLAGVGTYNFFLKSTPLHKMFFWTAILGTALGLTQLVLITRLNQALGISDEIFALGDSALLTVLGQVSFMPVLVLAARLCPEGVEATLFATLMSILNGGGFVGSALGSGLTQVFGVTSTKFDGLAGLVAVCTLSTLFPLLFLNKFLRGSESGEGKLDE